MPRKKSSNPKTTFIRARVTREMKEELNHLLALERKSESDFLREMASEYIRARRVMPTAPFFPGSGSAGAPVKPQVYTGDPPPIWTGTPPENFVTVTSAEGRV